MRNLRTFLEYSNAVSDVTVKDLKNRLKKLIKELDKFDDDDPSEFSVTNHQYGDSWGKLDTMEVSKSNDGTVVIDIELVEVR